MELENTIGKEGEVKWRMVGESERITTRGTIKAFVPDLWISIQAEDGYYSIPFSGQTKGIVEVSVDGKPCYVNHGVDKAYAYSNPDYNAREILKGEDCARWFNVEQHTGE